MAAPLLSLKDIALTFGGDPLLTSAEMIVHQGARIALVGRNGSGKSTFLKIAAGIVEPDGGERTVKSGTTFRYLEQDPDFSRFATAEDVVLDGLAPTDDPGEVGRLLAELGVDPQSDPKPLSGGEKRRVAIARALAPQPEVLLLDEPTNHLDLDTILWLEGELARLRSAIVLISHDRRFLENITRETVWLDRGETKHRDKGFKGFEDWRDQVFEEEELAAHKLDRKIVREEHWLRHGVSGRRKRNVRRLAELGYLRQQRAEWRGPQGSVDLSVSEAEASGKLVIEAKGISFAYGDRPIVKDLNLKLARGDRLGLVGPNGAGKTTLLRLLLDQQQADEGSVRHGTKLEIVGLDQERAGLKDNTRLMDALTEGRGDQITIGGQPRHALSYLKDFLFSPEQARQPIGALSGGERGRLALAIALAKPSNLLVLDEPTNDLDLETLDVLEEALANYQGTLMLVSHDRDFLDRVVTSTLTPVPEEGPGRWREYPGGYDDMMAQRKGATVPKDAAPAAKKTGGSAPQKKKPSGKLSFKDKHALETLPSRMEELEVSIAKHEAALSDPDLFTKDPAAFDKAQKGLTAAQEDLAAAEEQWLELEMKREELEG
ncbi:ATP-binding cassette domain-containing protein [Parvularcula sp. ZS-1/3]|uniref:ATP-binding cassette domain-containing protein n=1 Tax=Parvularcula mediterranea TaxID=2732508 RepID=A0A7Y3RLS6_9PROT|nr:ATP-binding cassette domain-containing protein [Parvularcula mediterranea]NNU16369.1 ATP-binding cassette domain-containing protein [Parvularcula mediterranea]